MNISYEGNSLKRHASFIAILLRFLLPARHRGSTQWMICLMFRSPAEVANAVPGISLVVDIFWCSISCKTVFPAFEIDILTIIFILKNDVGF